MAIKEKYFLPQSNWKFWLIGISAVIMWLLIAVTILVAKSFDFIGLLLLALWFTNVIIKSKSGSVSKLNVNAATTVAIIGLVFSFLVVPFLLIGIGKGV